MATVLDLIADSLLEIGVLAAGEVPTADEANSALRALNRMINAWQAERVYIFQTTRTEWTISANVGTYTVGPGGLVDRSLPVHIDSVMILETAFTPNYEIPLRIMTDQDYSEIRIKTQTSLWPQAVWYNRTFPLATLEIWPIPTSSTLKGVLYAPEAVGQFPAVTSTVSLPPAFERLIVKNLALEVAPSYGANVAAQLEAQAKDALAVVLRNYNRMREMRFDPGAAMTRRSYDIFSDLTRA